MYSSNTTIPLHVHNHTHCGDRIDITNQLENGTKVHQQPDLFLEQSKLINLKKKKEKKG